MCGSFLRLQHDWLSGNSRILHFRTGGTGKEERRRRSVLDGEAGAGIETWLRRTRPRPTETTPRDPRDCAGLTAPSHDRRKPIAADRLLSAQCRKRNSGLKLWPQVSQLRACDEVAQQLWTQRWNKRWSAGAAEQYLDGRSHNHAAGSEKSPVAWVIDPMSAKFFLMSAKEKRGPSDLCLDVFLLGGFKSRGSRLRCLERKTRLPA